MSPLFKKSMFRKIILIFIVLTLINAGAIYYFWDKNIELPLLYSLYGAEVLLFLFVIFVWKFISHPMKKILMQMKYLMTGKTYKKIYTKKIDELGFIAQFFNEITSNLESISKKFEEAQRMSSELEIASEIQKNILPDKSPEIANLEIATKNSQAVEVGGDSYDIIADKNNDNTFFYIGDVTGHGAPAALIMMMVNTLIHTYCEIYDNLYDIVVNTNKQLKPRIKAAMFMTMVMLKWNKKENKMSYIGAGHEHILIFRASKGVCEATPSGGIALGMIDDSSKIIKEQDLNLEKGDLIILYTDGITEAKNDAEEMYGLDRLKKAIEKFAIEYEPEGVLHHIALNFSNFVGETSQEDDITLIAIKYKEE